MQARPAIVDRVDVPGSLTNLIEFATGRAGIPALGFAVHIPHYLVNTEYPTGALTVIDEIGKAAELTLETGDLSIAAARVLAEIDESVASSAENQEVVAALEQQYDAETANWPNQLPSSEELMDQIEQFLADQDPEE
mgnify:FL=1